jgi:hypothetical protein
MIKEKNAHDVGRNRFDNGIADVEYEERRPIDTAVEVDRVSNGTQKRMQEQDVLEANEGEDEEPGLTASYEGGLVQVDGGGSLKDVLRREEVDEAATRMVEEELKSFPSSGVSGNEFRGDPAARGKG